MCISGDPGDVLHIVSKVGAGSFEDVYDARVRDPAKPRCAFIAGGGTASGFEADAAA